MKKKQNEIKMVTNKGRLPARRGNVLTNPQTLIGKD